MLWVAPSEKDTATSTLEKRLWAVGEAVSDEDFKEQRETLNEELETLNAQARELESTIAANGMEILEA